MTVGSSNAVGTVGQGVDPEPGVLAGGQVEVVRLEAEAVMALGSQPGGVGAVGAGKAGSEIAGVRTVGKRSAHDSGPGASASGKFSPLATMAVRTPPVDPAAPMQGCADDGVAPPPRVTGNGDPSGVAACRDAWRRQ
ncbi:MAG: hypothetical protein ACRDZW_01760 [Acidimicrobiales bacterium]